MTTWSAMRMRPGVLVAVLIGSVACGKVVTVDPDGGPGEDGGGDVDSGPLDPCEEGADPSVEEGLACTKRALCELFARCIIPLTPEECNRQEFVLWGDSERFAYALLIDAVEAGTVVYHPEEVAGCYQSFVDLTCSDVNQIDLDFFQFCPIFTGTVDDAGECFTDAECATPGATCSQDAVCAADQICCQRGCVAPVADGEVCAFNTTPCRPGSHCVDGDASSFCRSGEAGAPCQGSSECDRGLWCNASLCEAEVGPGEPCIDDYQCGGAETCIGDDLQGSDSGLCGRSDREGDPCDGFCSGFHCLIPDAATEPGECVPYVTEDGGDCSQVECSIQFECSADMECVRNGEPGDPCDSTSDCVFGYFCTSDIPGTPAGDGACSDRLIDGEPCGEDRHCDSGICIGDPAVCEAYPGCYQ
jgi:hypothetical protein